MCREGKGGRTKRVSPETTATRPSGWEKRTCTASGPMDSPTPTPVMAMNPSTSFSSLRFMPYETSPSPIHMMTPPQTMGHFGY